MENVAINALSNVSLGTLVMYTLAILFIGGMIYRFLEKYRLLRNTNDDKDKKIEAHSEQIAALGEKIDKVTIKLDSCIETIGMLKSEATAREARRLRKGILQFADDLREGRKPSLDMYKEIFQSNREYLDIINSTGMKNGFTEQEMEWIELNYKQDYCS